MERIKLYVKDEHRNRLNFRTDRAIELFNKISDGLKTLAISHTEDEVKELCTLSLEKVQKFVTEKFKNENKFLAKIAIEDMYEQVEGLITALNSPLMVNEYSFEFVEIIKGKAVKKVTANQDIEEESTVYLTDPDEIDFYKEYQEWLNKGNEIRAKFNKYISMEYLFFVKDDSFHPNNYLPFNLKTDIVKD